jgi:hypothetical protein
LFRQAPIRTTAAAVAFVNWFVFFAVSYWWIGGDAIGTTPSTQGFVVTSHGRTTSVTESVWLFSLLYPLATLTLTPMLWLSLAATQLYRIKGRARLFIIIFVGIWVIGWYFAAIRDGGRSLHDYHVMKAQ